MIKIKDVRLKLPNEANVKEVLDLDKLFSSSREHSDILIIFEINNKKIATIIEDTGRPEPKDFERIDKDVSELKRRGIIMHDMIIIKVVHHTGIGKGKNLIYYIVELQECKSIIDIEHILRKRHLI